MAEEQEVWRPFGVDTDDEIAEYDALHEGVTPWLFTPLWGWVGDAIILRSQSGSYYPDSRMLHEMGQALRLSLPVLAAKPGYECVKILQQKGADATLPIADYLLAFAKQADPAALDAILRRSNSAWKVGKRAGRYGLVRRVPEGVQVAADELMGGAGRAGVRLAKAWEALYGLNPDPSKAYSLAIKAVEDASVKLVCPKNAVPTLGTVIRDMENQKDWRLPMDQEHPKALSHDVVIGMLRVLWCGQHDRHGGGEPEKPGNVSHEEANVAVLLAVTLVGWFDAGLVARRT